MARVNDSMAARCPWPAQSRAPPGHSAARRGLEEARKGSMLESLDPAQLERMLAGVSLGGEGSSLKQSTLYLPLRTIQLFTVL